MVEGNSVNNNPVDCSSRVGVPRHTTPNGAAKPFFVGCAQIRKLYKKPAKPFQHRLRGLLHAWWSNGGQGGRWHWKKSRLKIEEIIDLLHLLNSIKGGS